jgi:hypothetical protein
MIGRSRVSATFCLLTNAILAPLLAAAPATQPKPPPPNPVPVNLTVDERGMTLGKFLPVLQERSPEFQYVAQPGSWQDFPLPPLRLQNLAVGQIVTMLTNLDPQLEVDEIGANSANNLFPQAGPVLYVFKSRPGAAPMPDDVRVMALGLGDAIDRLALRKAWAADAASPPNAQQLAAFRKEATDEILSLLEAAISQVPGKEPSLKLHKETAVLIVRGEERQLRAASQAIDALKSADDPKRYESQYIDLTNRFGRVTSQNKQLENELGESNRQYDELRASNRKLEQEVSDLKKQIETVLRKNNPGT